MPPLKRQKAVVRPSKRTNDGTALQFEKLKADVLVVLKDDQEPPADVRPMAGKVLYQLEPGLYCHVKFVTSKDVGLNMCVACNHITNG